MARATEFLDALKAGKMELQPVVKTLGLGGLNDWKPGWAQKIWAPRPELLKSDDTMFGGYIAALADQILTFAAFSVLPEDNICKTVSLNVQFFNEQITIEARVTAQGRQVISTEAEFHNPGGDLLAKATSQFVVTPILEKNKTQEAK